MEILNPVYEAIPKYLRTHNYRGITNLTDSPYQLGHKITERPFVWFQQNPKKFELFLKWMAHNRDGLPSWLETYPFEQEVGSTNDETVLFVDIGSVLGHQSIELRERFPKLPERIIIQDQEHVILAIKPPHSVQ
ncbi:hypothetical protein PMIN06_008519 [Paraphaeosphaeria minitans]